jgi:hypothetical protein
MGLQAGTPEISVKRSTWFVSHPVDTLLHRLHDFFMGMRLALGSSASRRASSTSRVMHSRIPPATAFVPCAATLGPTGAADQTGACRRWRRCAPESVPGSPRWHCALLVRRWLRELHFLGDPRPSAGQRLDAGHAHLLIHLRSRRCFRAARSCGLRPLWLAMRSAVAAWRLTGQ